MEYIVSARKYRPLSFDTVVGQTALTTTLKNAVKSGKLAHAYLFCGPRGVGKTTCARIFAKAINCENPTSEGEACNLCESCRAFNEQRSYNIFELDAASNNSVDNIKTLMEQTRIPPQVGKYKVFIIDEVHMLSTQAFNAFLKTLEEPPAHVIFILATTEKHKILPTIISRCQIYDFERMTVPNIVNHLKMVAEKEGVSYEEDALNVIAEKADGGMRDALSIFDQAISFCQGNITYDKVIEDLNVLDSEYYFKIIDYSLENKVSEVMVLLNTIISKGFDGGNLISGLAAHVRNVMMAKDNQTLPLLEVSQRQVEKFAEQAKKCDNKFLYRALKIMNDCDINYRQSSNKRLLVELTLIQVAQITQDEESPVAGRSPKRLKTLFKKIISGVQTKAASQVAAERKQSQIQHAKTNPSMSNSSQETSDSQPSSIVNGQSSSEQNPSSTASKIPKMRLTNIGNSFTKVLGGEHHSGNGQEEVADNMGGHASFDNEMLRIQWMAMCNRMPHEMTGMAARMRNMLPEITKFPHVEVVVDNKILLEQMNKVSSRIKKTLTKYLHNDDITLTLRLAEVGEVKKILNNRDLLVEMMKKNSAIENMQSLLDLELA